MSAKDVAAVPKSNIKPRIRLERQIILRLPPDVAARLHAVLRKNQDPNNASVMNGVLQSGEDIPKCSIQFSDSRRGKISFQLPPVEGEKNEAEKADQASGDQPSAQQASTDQTSTSQTSNTESANSTNTEATSDGAPPSKKPRLVRDEMDFILADLPCVLESYRTNTQEGSTSASSDGHLVKSADIGQIMVAKKPGDKSPQCCDKKGRFPSGLTPLTYQILAQYEARNSERKYTPDEIREIEDQMVVTVKQKEQQEEEQQKLLRHQLEQSQSLSQIPLPLPAQSPTLSLPSSSALK